MTVATDVFAPLGYAEAAALGRPNLPLVLIPHPIGGQRPEEVRAKAEAVAEAVIAALTTGRVEI